MHHCHRVSACQTAERGSRSRVRSHRHRPKPIRLREMRGSNRSSLAFRRTGQQALVTVVIARVSASRRPTAPGITTAATDDDEDLAPAPLPSPAPSCSTTTTALWPLALNPCRSMEAVAPDGAGKASPAP